MKRYLLLSAAFLTLATTLGTTLSACTPARHTNGIFLTQDDIAPLTPGVSTRADVLQTLGTPTTQALFDNDTWYYIGLKTQKDAFFDPKVTERSVYEATFDEDGVLLAITQKEADAINVPIARRTTPSAGHDLTVMQQLLGNLGRFNRPAGGVPGQI